MNPILYQLCNKKVKDLGAELIPAQRNLFVIYDSEVMTPVTGKELLELAAAKDRKDFQKKLLEISVSDLRAAS